VDSPEGACAAAGAGAGRIELSVGLEVGGLTPSSGLLREVLASARTPVIALIRPVPGGFVYGEAVRRVIRTDTADALAAGAAGIAVGALLPDGAPDCAFMEELRRIAEGSELVFHRAFDRISDKEAALPRLASAGVDRILTSGGAPSALSGVATLRRLVRLCGTGSEILPGGGITPENAAAIVRGTGCRALHGSFSARVSDGEPPDPFPGGGRRTDPEQVRRTVEVLRGL